MDHPIVDCVIVGAGPGGLTAATYLGRYRRSTIVIDGGASRASWIPASHNCPGFPSGIGGQELLSRLRRQAGEFGSRHEIDHVVALGRDGNAFVLTTAHRQWRARCVILATGCEDVLPDLPDIDAAIDCGAIRLCPICDAYEAIDQDIAVHGEASVAAPHARFVRTFSRRVTLVPTEPVQDNDLLQSLAKAGIAVTSPSTQMRFDGRQCRFAFEGKERAFDVVYPALGALPRSELAVQMGADCDEEGGLIVSSRQMTSIDGLYAIGDVVSALNQISVATGHAAVAATAVHRQLGDNFA